MLPNIFRARCLVARRPGFRSIDTDVTWSANTHADAAYPDRGQLNDNLSADMDGLSDTTA